MVLEKGCLEGFLPSAAGTLAMLRALAVFYCAERDGIMSTHVVVDTSLRKRLALLCFSSFSVL